MWIDEWKLCLVQTHDCFRLPGYLSHMIEPFLLEQTPCWCRIARTKWLSYTTKALRWPFIISHFWKANRWIIAWVGSPKDPIGSNYLLQQRGLILHLTQNRISFRLNKFSFVISECSKFAICFSDDIARSNLVVVCIRIVLEIHDMTILVGLAWMMVSIFRFDLALKLISMVSLNHQSHSHNFIDQDGNASWVWWGRAKHMSFSHLILVEHVLLFIVLYLLFGNSAFIILFGSLILTIPCTHPNHLFRILPTASSVDPLAWILEQLDVV